MTKSKATFWRSSRGRSGSELAQEVDEPAHGADEIALLAAERGLHDAGPVVVTRGPAVDGRHEPGLHADGHGQVARALGLEHRVGDGDEAVDLAAQLVVP